MYTHTCIHAWLDKDTDMYVNTCPWQLFCSEIRFFWMLWTLHNLVDPHMKHNENPTPSRVLLFSHSDVGTRRRKQIHRMFQMKLPQLKRGFSDTFFLFIGIPLDTNWATRHQNRLQRLKLMSRSPKMRCDGTKMDCFQLKKTMSH